MSIFETNTSIVGEIPLALPKVERQNLPQELELTKEQISQAAKLFIDHHEAIIQTIMESNDNSLSRLETQQLISRIINNVVAENNNLRISPTDFRDLVHKKAMDHLESKTESSEEVKDSTIKTDNNSETKDSITETNTKIARSIERKEIVVSMQTFNRYEAYPTFSLSYLSLVNEAIRDGKLELNKNEKIFLEALCSVDEKARNEFANTGSFPRKPERTKDVKNLIGDNYEISATGYQTKIKRLNAKLKKVVPPSLHTFHRSGDLDQKLKVGQVLLNHQDTLLLNTRAVKFLEIRNQVVKNILDGKIDKSQYKKAITDLVNNDNSKGSLKYTYWQSQIKSKTLPPESSINDTKKIKYDEIRLSAVRDITAAVKFFDFRAETDPRFTKERAEMFSKVLDISIYY